MRTKTFLSVFGVLAITLFFFSFGWAQSKPDSKAPIITHSFAVEKAYYGYIWKIYIEAEDPDGDMYKIASVVDHTGYGRYPPDWIIIKPQYRNRLKGYLQWNTFSSKSFYLREWTIITLKVSIIDKAGNESNEVIFPFTFETGIKNPYEYELPPPFNGGDLPRLGYIAIDLVEPTMGSHGGGWRDD
jgi:hypothetical protein